MQDRLCKSNKWSETEILNFQKLGMPQLYTSALQNFSGLKFLGLLSQSQRFRAPVCFLGPLKLRGSLLTSQCLDNVLGQLLPKKEMGHVQHLS